MNTEKCNNLLEKINSFKEFEDEISEFTKDDKIKLFTLFVYYLLQSDYRFNHIVKKVYLSKDIPNKLLKEIEFKEDDLDILIKTKEDDFIPVQCVYKSDCDSVISWKNIDEYYYDSYLFTNTYNYCDELNETSNITTFGKNYFNNLKQNDFDNIKLIINDDSVDYPDIILEDYHTESISKIKEHYKNSRRGIIHCLSCPKTNYLIYATFKSYEKIIIFVDSITTMQKLYNDILYYNILKNNTYNILLVDDSEIKIDGINLTLNDKLIKDFLRSPNDYIVICNYEHTEMLNKIIKNNKIYFDFGIFHEFERVPDKKNIYHNNPIIFSKYINNKLFISKKLYLNKERYGKKITRINVQDFENGKIYKITDLTNNDIYIGSTTQKYLNDRLSAHEYGYTEWKKKISNRGYVKSYDIIKNDNYIINLIEKYPCNNQIELHTREGYYIRKIKCINKIIPTRTNKEWRKTNHDRLSKNKKVYDEKYRILNEDKIKIRCKNYREKNKKILSQKKVELIACTCGFEYTRSNRARHEKSKLHLNNI